MSDSEILKQFACLEERRLKPFLSDAITFSRARQKGMVNEDAQDIGDYSMSLDMRRALARTAQYLPNLGRAVAVESFPKLAQATWVSTNHPGNLYLGPRIRGESCEKHQRLDSIQAVVFEEHPMRPIR
ncbi:hypothetical protein HZB90_02790, partial [archaeon]|nr:hypothetical protein [archaeon]